MNKEKLRQYRHLERERRQIGDMLFDLEAMMTSPKAQRLDGMPHASSGFTQSAIEGMVARHMELQQRYQEKLEELAAAMQEIEDAIEGLEPRERTLLRLHYIQGLTLERVCVEMNYSWRQINRIHGKALKKLKGENT